MYFSLWLDLPTGATIVCTFGAVLVLMAAVRPIAASEQPRVRQSMIAISLSSPTSCSTRLAGLALCLRPGRRGVFASHIGQLRTPARAAAVRWLDAHRSNADRLIKEAQADQFAWNRLAELTDTYGNRLAGSENLTRAIAWAVEAMKKDGLENVRTEKVMVPRWVRGQREPRDHRPAAATSFRCSVSAAAWRRRPRGIEADVVVVKSYDELDAARR